LIYSITSRESFEKIREIWGEVREVKEEMGMWEPFQIGLVGNKMDLEGERVVSVHEGMGVAETLGCAFWEAEAETGRNTKELVEELVRKVRTYRDNERIRYEQMKEEAEKAKKEKVKNERRKKMMPWKRLFS
jgi:GTPase SAR1 family protein